MFIKKLTIQGFKSYRDSVVVDPFSPGVNVVVGRNGSGKSNFFSAIRFVLGDAYTSLSRDARQALLHEGVATTSTFSAFVEIVFDNSDNRFPTGKDEVILRRTVGAKKDEYSLDRKSTGKGEVMSLLESAGFSKSNPYYIVPQGRITHLTNQKDPERLELLKEVAGTNVYEDRRAESIKNIAEAEAKRAKVDELLEVIEERLNELEEEKKELKEFSTKDKERRCLEYSIYQRELTDVTAKLSEIEEERADIINAANEARDAFQARQREIVTAEQELSEQKQELDLLEVEKGQLISDRQEAIKTRTQVECLVRDMSDASTSSAVRQAAIEQELSELRASIEKRERELRDDINPASASAAEQLQQLQTRLNDATTRSDALYAKQGRSSQFRTQRERDDYLSSEIADLEARIKAKEQRVHETQTLVDRSKTQLEQLQTRLKSVSSDVDGRRSTLQDLYKESASLSARKTELSERRKELWKEEQRLKTTSRHAQDQATEAQSSLMRAMDRNAAAGLKALSKITREHNLPGVYGPLYQLFTVPEVYRQATEVTAGASLFHVVVDNDSTATKVLELMRREKAGRVTFMPLNRLKPKAVQYPENDNSVQPLIKKLSYEPMYAKAFQQVFSKTLVCESLHSASTAMRTYQLNVITLDGDKIDRKGAMTGGYHDIRRSRLQAAEQLHRWTTAHATESARLVDVVRTRQQLDQEITQLEGKLTIAQTKLRQLESSREPMMLEANTLRDDILREETRVQRMENALQNVEGDVKNSRTQLAAYQSELEQPMEQNLSSEEVKALTELTKTIETHQNEWSAVSKQYNSLESRKRLLEIELNENLRRKQEELKGKLEAGFTTTTADDMTTGDLEAKEAEVKTLEASIAHHSSRLTEVEAQVETVRSNIQRLTAEVDKFQTQQVDDARGIARQSKGTERYHSKKSLLEARKEETEGHIRDLGVLPEEAFEKYIDMDSDQLVSKLHKVNDALKKFSSVNRKAVEQFSNFATQKEELQERREELNKSSESIEQLLQVLDQRKDEAIERTFKQVSKNFSDVFERLVPTGRGRLIMLKSADEDLGAEDTTLSEQSDQSEDDDQDEEEDDETESDEEAGPRRRRGTKRSKRSSRAKKDKSKKQKQANGSKISTYTGVAIRVSFSSKVDEGMHIQQLSGGQKSLVALALVFAIQKCDPAPFYLFDEIDANLDADRRTAVAAMIKELSEDAQFIITTFRAELLAHADQFFGVIFDARKVSTVKSITREDCEMFVEANDKST